METNRPLQTAGYLLALLLTVVPLYDAATSIWPPHLSDERWRWGSVGALSNLTLVPLLGLFIGLVIATFADDRRTRRFIGWICGLLAVVVAIAAVLFILDYFQTRTLVRPQFQHQMGIATATALAKHILTVIGLALLSRAGLSGPRAVVRSKRPVTAEPTRSPLISVGGTSAE